MADAKHDCDLVLEGGGVKGTALVGALAALEEAGYRFRRIAGTSAGALVGAFAAAGMTMADLHALLLDTDYTTYLDNTFWNRIPVPLVGAALSELFDRGLYKGDALHDFVAKHLAVHGITTFADLRVDDPGLDPNTPPERRYRLVVVASDLTRQRLVRIPWYVEREYGIAPDRVPVADAVRMSTAIPFFFTPFPLLSLLTKEHSVMVDGGLVSNFPVDIFDRTDGLPPRWPTICISVMSPTPPTQVMPEPSGPVDFVRALVLTGVNGRDNAELDAPGTAERTVYIDTSYAEATDFSIDRATRERLYESGHAAAKAYLSGH